MVNREFFSTVVIFEFYLDPIERIIGFKGAW